ncbi:MAG: aldehyde dehydrogenase family protein, partial [Steroidobacteraceae bacterium]|nr:aldehyde dehydrogenase family protein [Steroidobacteraceae bacterium]
MKAAATTLTAIDPRTGREDYRFHVASRAEVAQACAQVRAAQPSWHALGFDGRASALRALGAAVARHAEALGAALARDTGRTRIAQIEVAAMQGILAHTLNHAAQVFAPQPEQRSVVAGITARRELVPYPVVGVI